MKLSTTILAALVALSFVPAAADAMLVTDAADVFPSPCDTHSAAEIAEAGGVFTETEPTTTPGLFLTTHAICYVEASDVAPLTDCTATSYSLTGWKWTSAYNAVVDTTNSYGFSSSAVVSAFNSGSNTWDQAVAADIFGSFSAGGNAKNVRTLDGINQHGWGRTGGTTIAVTYTWSSGGNAVESDALYNTRFTWSLSGEAGKMDVLNIQTHEIGHTFGMGHSANTAGNSCLTMFPSGSNGETQKRTLGDGDLLGIEAIY